MNTCPFCKSINVDIFNTSYIHKRLKDHQPYRSGNLLITPDPYNVSDYLYDEILCKDCGQISKSLQLDALKQYNRDYNNFVG